MQPSALDIRPPVAAALEARRAVVAMGSAPLAHSLPWPTNVETIQQAEAGLHEEGATLAIVGVWRGRLTIGLSAAEVEALAKDAGSLRASRRDLAAAVVKA